MLQKIENYLHALTQLEQAVAIYQNSRQDALYRDGLIQRFEFTVELAWKSIKEYLEDQGSTVPISTPRAVLKDAFAAGMIQDGSCSYCIRVSNGYDRQGRQVLVNRTFTPPQGFPCPGRS
ncbi:MAG: HI0074 family nucleotidyltransferase substrate-binding subunit [Faecalibacterium sp.]